MGKLKTQEQYEKELYDFNPNVKIIDEYISSHTKTNFKCLIHNCTYKQEPVRALYGFGCKQCIKENLSKIKRFSEQYYIDKLKSINKNIKLIDKYVNEHTKIKHKCMIDGYEWDVTPDSLLRGQGCPVCSNKAVLKGINDMWTTNPELAKLLANPEDGYKYTRCSGKKVEWRCPNCGSIIKDKQIRNVSFQGLSCKFCSDGISYPNKVLANLFLQLDVVLITEYSPNWIKPKRFDGFFIFNNKEYIVEMDGALGHGNKMHNKSKIIIEESKEIDNYKDRMAKEHGIKVIRIDCKISDIDYIKNNIIHSKLNDLFNFSNVDWNKVHIESLKSNVIKVCKLWVLNNSVTDIFNILKIPRPTIIGYIRKGEKCGLCHEYTR